MMTLVYVTNERIGEVADLSFNGRVSYRNPRYWKGETERCDQVYIHGDWPEIEKAYEGKVIQKEESSTDYTIAELREMNLDEKPESFFEGDKRSSIDQIR